MNQFDPQTGAPQAQNPQVGSYSQTGNPLQTGRRGTNQSGGAGNSQGAGNVQGGKAQGRGGTYKTNDPSVVGGPPTRQPAVGGVSRSSVQAQPPAPVRTQTAAPVAQPQTVQRKVAIDLSIIKTKTGKGVRDFEIPEELIKTDPSLIDLIIKSESMNDGERQYWFNLTEIMSEEQTEKLRGILVRERSKLAEIEAKYGKPKVQLSPDEVAAKNAEQKKKREQQQQYLAEKEAKYQKQEEADEAAILAELESI